MSSTTTAGWHPHNQQYALQTTHCGPHLTGNSSRGFVIKDTHTYTLAGSCTPLQQKAQPLWQQLHLGCHLRDSGTSPHAHSTNSSHSHAAKVVVETHALQQRPGGSTEYTAAPTGVNGAPSLQHCISTPGHCHLSARCTGPPDWVCFTRMRDHIPLLILCTHGNR